MFDCSYCGAVFTDRNLLVQHREIHKPTTTSGEVVVSGGSSLTRAANYTQTGGSTIVDGVLTMEGGIVDLRGGGLGGSGQVNGSVDTKRLTAAFIANGILTKETRSRTFRFAPPISIEDELIAEIVSRARAALSSVC